MPGSTMAATHTAQTRSQPTSTRRAGYRSATGASRAPPRAYGRNPSAKVRALQQRRGGGGEDEDGQRDHADDDAAEQGEDVRGEDEAELPHPEDGAIAARTDSAGAGIEDVYEQA